MKSVYRSLLFLVFVGCFATELYAQKTQVNTGPDPGFARRWRIGLNLGPDFYYGDLNSSKFLPEKSISFAAGLFTEYQVTNVFGLRLQFLGSWLNGAKTTAAEGTNVQDAFTGILTEGSLNAQINFSNLFSPYRNSRKLFIYGTVGIGYAGWYTELINKVYDAATINTDNPAKKFKSAPVVPAGFGLMYRLGNKVNLGIEWTFRTVFSDMVDQTAGGFKYDIYNYLAFGVSINLGKTESKAPKPYNYTYPVTAPPAKPVPPPPAEPVKYNPMPALPAGDYVYVVQIFAFDRHKYSPEWIRKRYKVPQPVRMEKEGQMERFLVGSYKNLQYATELKEQMIRLGIRDAFVVAYKDGVRSHVIPGNK